MKISACVIVKNEEKHLPKWLDCVKRLATELVVVDTGSSDATVAIAKAAGAKVFHFPWIDDFAAAKNYAIEQVTGDWIINLDADETFSPEDGQKVLSLIRRYHGDPKVGGFMCRCVDIDPGRDNRYLGGHILLRVFRNHPDLRYEGRIHELLTNHGAKTMEMKVAPDIVILHTGYAQAVLEEKARRNLALLLAEQKRRGEKPEDAFYLADCFLSLGEYEKAIQYTRQVIDSGARFLGMTNHPYLMLIRLLILSKRPMAEVDEAIAAGREKFPSMPEFVMMEGFAAWERQQYLRAEERLRRGLDLYQAWQEASVQDVYLGDQARNLLPEVYDFLGRIAAMRGDEGEAGRCFVESLKRQRRDDRLARLCRILRRLPPEEAILILRSLYPEEEAAGTLARKLYGEAMPQVCLYYERQSGEKIYGDFDRYVFAGRGMAAAALAADAAQALTGLGRWVLRQGAAGEGLPLLLSAGAAIPKTWTLT